MSEHPIPVKVRTARKTHTCNDCEKPIEPGEKYELAVFPPHSIDVWDVDHWIAWRTHYPHHDGTNFLIGCAISAAYRENGARDLALAAAGRAS